VVLFVLLAGDLPLREKDVWSRQASALTRKAIGRLARGRLHNRDGRPAAASRNSLALLEGLLQPDPAQRWSAERALEHPWLALARDIPVAPKGYAAAVRKSSASSLYRERRASKDPPDVQRASMSAEFLAPIEESPSKTTAGLGRDFVRDPPAEPGLGGDPKERSNTTTVFMRHVSNIKSVSGDPKSLGETVITEPAVALGNFRGVDDSDDVLIEDEEVSSVVVHSAPAL
jgi:serine/threonine protein kinase